MADDIRCYKCNAEVGQMLALADGRHECVDCIVAERDSLRRHVTVLLEIGELLEEDTDFIELSERWYVAADAARGDL